MKKTKTIFTMLATAAMLFLLPFCSSLKVSADEPVTYAVKYLPDEKDWRYQADTSTFNEDDYHRELYYMRQTIKDGDIVVVYNSSPDSNELDLGNTHLSNLTIVDSQYFSIIHTGDIDDCYVLAGASCSINGNITNAYVYDSVLCNFGKNVQNLTIYAEDDVTSTIGCSGTVAHLYAPSITLPRTFYDLYDFQADSLSIKDGILQTPEYKYSKEAPAPAATPSPTPVPPQPSSPSAADNSEYDSVPKTGETNAALWYCITAVFCIIGCFSLKNTKKS